MKEEGRGEKVRQGEEERRSRCERQLKKLDNRKREKEVRKGGGKMGSKGGRGKLRARGKGEDVRDNLRSIEKNEGEGGGKEVWETDGHEGKGGRNKGGGEEREEGRIEE